MNQIERVARTAARWWADKMRTGAGIGKNGDTDQHRSGMLMMLTQLARANAKITKAKCDAFERALVPRVIAGIKGDRRKFGYDSFTLSTDYDPEWDLADALNDAGVDPMDHRLALPWKTYMYVHADAVEVADGYGAPMLPVPLIEIPKSNGRKRARARKRRRGF